MNFFTSAEEFLRKANPGEGMVFTNGCFDILHVGHVRYLQASREQGRYLVVGLNSDSSVKKLKGTSRPVNTESDRAEVLLGLSSVDYVVLFNEDTPLKLIESLKPQILTKGGDYKKETIVGAHFVESLGGKVVIIPFEPGYSTTATIGKMGKEK